MRITSGERGTPENTRNRYDDEHPYRMYVSFSPERNQPDLIRNEFESWLRTKKGWDVSLSETGAFNKGNRTVTVVRHTVGETSLMRMKMVEHSASVDWTTEMVTSTNTEEGCWIHLEVRNNAGSWVAVPGVARQLIELLSINQTGPDHISGEPSRIPVGEVDELVNRIQDRGRHSLIFVAGTDDRLPFDIFAKYIGRVTHQTSGQAEVAVLDPRATQLFQDRVGQEHRVNPWTIRTFDTELDFNDPTDHLRHRFLSTEKLGDLPDHVIIKLLGRTSRRHAANHRLPGSVIQAKRTLDRIEAKKVIATISVARDTTVGLRTTLATEPEPPTRSESALAEAPTATGSVTTPGSTPTEPTASHGKADDDIVRFLRDELGLKTVSPTSLRGYLQQIAEKTEQQTIAAMRRRLEEQRERTEKMLEERQQMAERLEDLVDELREEVEDWQIEARSEAEERQRLSDETRWLRKSLKDAKAFDVSNSPVPDNETTESPSSYLALLELLPTLADRNVVFTGDSDACLKLDSKDPLGRGAMAAWEASLVLADYLRAKQDGKHAGNVHEYLCGPPEGYRSISPKKHAPTETRATMDRWGSERIFPVPESVAATEQAEMTAHFKLVKLGIITPRLYYLDRSHHDGHIYIGYIGQHLTNTQTN